MTRSSTAQKELIENPLRKPVNTLAIVPTKSSKITVLARKAYNVLLYIAQEQGIDQEVFRAPLQSTLLRISEERDRCFRHRDRRFRERDRSFR